MRSVSVVQSRRRVGAAIGGAHFDAIAATLSPESSASAPPRGVVTTSSSRGRRVRPGERDRDRVVAATRRHPAVDGERLVDDGERRRRRSGGHARADPRARMRMPSRAHAMPPAACEAQRVNRRTVSSRTALSGALFNCDCQRSCARARSPFAHSTSPRCAAISGSGRCSIARRRYFSASSERAHPVLRPADAVEDERIVRRERQRALDQRETLGDARRPVDERVAQRVQRMRIGGPELDQARELRLDDVQPVELFGHHRDVVEEIGIVGILVQRARQDRVGRLVVAGIAQELRRWPAAPGPAARA